MTEAHALGERQIDSSTIDESLGQILRSARFKDSMQLQTLLRYIVEESLKGHDDALKERIIGIDVFGRKPDYDTSDDPIVRSRVGLLRKRLAQYYESEEARSSAVQIVIPSGSYHPTFVFHRLANNENKESPAKEKPQTAVSHGTEDNPESGAASHVPSSFRAPRWRVWGIIAVASCSLLLAAWVAVANWNKNELYLLWKPILESKKTVLLYNGTINPIYLLSLDNVNSTSPPGDQDLPASAPSLSSVEGPTLTAGEFVPVQGGLVPPGDIAADLKVAALMNTYNRSLSMRSGTGLPFVDLQGSPTVLIGAYDNYWTMSLARDLPFFFDRSGRIRERSGQHRVWSSVARADNTISEDYAVFFRLLDSKVGGPVIAISGLTTCGTQAAAQFATDPVQLKRISNIPRNALKQKNIEFVLRTSLVNCTPTSVDIVAQQVW
jgi:hypothetical protein